MLTSPVTTCSDLTPPSNGKISSMVPLTTDQWVPWLPTAVTLATLLMEGAIGLVRVTGHGVSQLRLLVKVSLSTFPIDALTCTEPNTTPSVSCGPPPSIDNGSPGTPTSAVVGGTVTYSCDPGYIMSDSTNNSVTCLSTGQWSAPPSCLSELLTGLLDTAPQVFSPLQSFLQSTSLSPPPTTCLVSQKSPCPLWERGVAVLLSVTRTHTPAVDSWTLEWRVVWGSGTIRMAQSLVLTQKKDCM